MEASQVSVGLAGHLLGVCCETEKGFLKQPKVFFVLKEIWERKEECEGEYIKISIPLPDGFNQGCFLEGTCHSAKMQRKIIVRRNFLQFVKKCQRYEKRNSDIPAHVSPCFHVIEGDHIIIGKCRPLSKAMRFNVLKVIPAGSFVIRKKAFTGM